MGSHDAARGVAVGISVWGVAVREARARSLGGGGAARPSTL